jgi:GcrA cell cycle regulator
MSYCWTEDVLRAARRLYLEEGLSAAESARRLGVTRSALIGKAHRMGWAAERDPRLAIANQVRCGRAVARALRPARPDIPLPPEPFVACEPRPWLERAPGQCAFPVSGEGEAVMSCCGPSGLKSYCPGHTAAMYVRRSAAQMQALDRIADWVDRMEQPPEAEPAKGRTLRRASARR